MPGEKKGRKRELFVVIFASIEHNQSRVYSYSYRQTHAEMINDDGFCPDILCANDMHTNDKLPNPKPKTFDPYNLFKN